MRPLQSIAIGLVIIALRAEFGGYDALADPVGWLLVLFGVRSLPVEPERRRSLVAARPSLAGVVSVPLWIPGVSDAIEDVHASLLWVATCPSSASPRCSATAWWAGPPKPGDNRAAAWLRFLRVGFVAVALLPVLVFGGGRRRARGCRRTCWRRCCSLTLICLLAARGSAAGPGSTAPGDATRAVPPAAEERPS